MKGSGITSSIIYQLMENVGTKAITAFLSLVIARILSPDDYGIVAIVSVFVALSDVIVQSGLSIALIQKKEVDELDYNTSFYISFVLAFLTYVALFAAAPFVSDFYNLPDLSALIRFQGLVVFLSPFNNIYTAKTRRKMQFKLLMVCNITSSISSGVIGVVLACCGAGVWSLVAQALAQKAIAFVLMAFRIRWYPGLAFSIKRGLPLYKFGYKVLLSNVLNVLSGQISSLVIGKAFSSSDLAYYQQGSLYPRTITESLNNAIQNVMLVPMSRVKHDLAAVRGYCQKTSMMSYFVVAPCMFGLAATAQTLVPVLLTEKWNPLIPFLWVYCASYLLYPLASSGYQVLMALGKSGVYLVFNVFNKTIFLILLFVGAFVLDSVMAIAMASLLSSLFSAVFNAILLRRNVGYKLGDQVRDIASSLIISMGMFGILFVMNHLPLPPAVILVLQIITGGMLYILFSVGLKVRPYRILLEQIKSKS